LLNAEFQAHTYLDLYLYLYLSTFLHLLLESHPVDFQKKKRTKEPKNEKEVFLPATNLYLIRLAARTTAPLHRGNSLHATAGSVACIACTAYVFCTHCFACTPYLILRESHARPRYCRSLFCNVFEVPSLPLSLSVFSSIEIPPFHVGKHSENATAASHP
jgi:hypothetical protein